ncbi:MAG: catalytic domain of component of various dehydrogenase complexe, partial [Thermoleophilia bacterium]|nr:catalytic domain of component of various dehydrogenase complexe [Thermoleophilia bacterium]
GDTIDKGDELYEVETEKVNVEVEAPAGGTILKVLVEAGQTVAIGTTLAWIGEAGEEVPAGEGDDASAASELPSAAEAAEGSPAAAERPGSAASASGASGASPTPASPAPAPAAPTGASASVSGRLKASPLARRIAGERGIDLATISGSGPDGRVVARDLEGAAASTEAAAAPAPVAAPVSTASGAGVERVELTSMRRTIARRLTEAWQAPAFYLTRDVEMTAANELRARILKGVREGDVRPTVSDIITKASAIALRAHRDVNAHFAGDAILKFEAVHVGMAVATPAGLVVPVIRDAHAKTIKEIAADRAALVAKARNGKLQPADFEGGTFTISNLGMMGVDEFTAVLNPPAAGILAVGRTADRAVVVDRRVEVRAMMTITLGLDHRVVDGAVGAAFLATLVEHLEDPTTML